VVGVPVGVHDVGHRVVRPPPQRLDDGRAGAGAARVEGDEAIARAHQHDVGERLDDGDAVRDLGELLGDPVLRILGDAGVDDA
jgi:hypothetical protein